MKSHFLALEFAEKGFKVLGTVRDPSKYTSPHPNITFLPLELTSIESIRELRKRVTDITGGKLDVLYNNAGRNYVVPALDYEIDELHELFEANVFAVMHMCREFTPLLIEAKGTIVQTGSVAGIMPYVWGAPYNASKAALHSFSNTLRVELAPLGVRVVNVITGGVKSNIARTHRELPSDSYHAAAGSGVREQIDTQPTAGYGYQAVCEELRESGRARRRLVWSAEGDLGRQDELDCVVRMEVDANQNLRLVLYLCVQAWEAEGDCWAQQEDAVI